MNKMIISILLPIAAILILNEPIKNGSFYKSTQNKKNEISLF